MKKRKIKIPTRLIIVLCIGLFGIYLFFVLLSNFLWSSSYFNVRTVVSSDKNLNLSYLLGKNIFSLDLKQEAQRIIELFPGYNHVRLIRQLPSRLKVELQKRAAIAYIKLSRYFAVDGEGVLFSLDSQSVVNLNLPVITGMESRLVGPKAGKSYSNIKELALSLQLIREIYSFKELRGYPVKKIDASSVANFSFYVLDNLEIKIGQGSLRNKLSLLSAVYNELGSRLLQVRYVDLRFKEPVVKYK